MVGPSWNVCSWEELWVGLAPVLVVIAFVVGPTSLSGFSLVGGKESFSGIAVVRPAVDEGAVVSWFPKSFSPEPESTPL